MEKLILRGVMYGADKIPDKWFEKVPGGFYKEKEEKRRRDSRERHDRDRGKSQGRRHHRDNYDDRRRRSDDERGQAARPGRNSERQKRTGRAASLMDGGNDYDPYFDGDRPRAVGRHTRYDTRDDRYAYGDGYDSRDRLEEGRYEPPSLGTHHSRTRGRERAATVGVAAAAGAAAARGRDYPPRSAQSTDGPGVYVPYADIYGRADDRRHSVAGSAQSTSRSPVADVKPRRNDHYDRHDNEYDLGYVPPTRPPPQSGHRDSLPRRSYDTYPQRTHSERRHPLDQRSNNSSRNGSNSARESRREARQKDIRDRDRDPVRYEPRDRNRPTARAIDTGPSE